MEQHSPPPPLPRPPPRPATHPALPSTVLAPRRTPRQFGSCCPLFIKISNEQPFTRRGSLRVRSLCRRYTVPLPPTLFGSLCLVPRGGAWAVPSRAEPSTRPNTIGRAGAGARAGVWLAWSLDPVPVGSVSNPSVECTVRLLLRRVIGSNVTLLTQLPLPHPYYAAPRRATLHHPLAIGSDLARFGPG